MKKFFSRVIFFIISFFFISLQQSLVVNSEDASLITKTAIEKENKIQTKTTQITTSKQHNIKNNTNASNGNVKKNEKIKKNVKTTNKTTKKNTKNKKVTSITNSDIKKNNLKNKQVLKKNMNKKNNINNLNCTNCAKNQTTNTNVKSTNNNINDTIKNSKNENHEHQINEMNEVNKVNTVIDKIENSLKQNDSNDAKNSFLLDKNFETYAGMVGDKRKSNGISLDLTMDTYSDGHWLLHIEGKGVDNKNIVSLSSLEDGTRFFINVNTSILRDKVLNFTYQIPKNIRLNYGHQLDGYRIIINLPKETKILSKNISNGKILVNFVNQKIIDENIAKKHNYENVNNSKQSTPNTIDTYSEQNEIKDISDNVAFNKIKIKRNKNLVVAIDAGHGGLDSGAISISGRYEKNITLIYAKSLENELKKRSINVVMTRRNDKTLSLAERVNVAKKANADLFISLHTDAHNNHKITGTTVYCLSYIDKNHPHWNKFYNKNYLPKHYEEFLDNKNVLDILLYMSHRTLFGISSMIVDNILLSFKKNGICKNCRHGQRSLGVLRGLDMPSVLIEIGYITNKDEERKILLKNNIENFTSNLADVVLKTFKE